ncbi:MAG: RluA family pseudouridine synthase [Bacteroidota bacterium]
MNDSLQQIIVDPKQSSQRIDKFLISKLPDTTRTTVQTTIKQGDITVNEAPVKPSYLIKPHDRINIKLTDHFAKKIDILPENIDLNIVYEDSAIVVVNKSASMVVHPACDNWHGTLVNALLYHYQKLPSLAGNENRPGLVHRIDKGTSGLLVIGKTKKSLDRLSKQFMHHSIERKYLALVWGNVESSTGTIDMPLKRSAKDRRIVEVCKAEEGKRAITHYHVLERLGYVTLLACRLETGRTHQIRAHMKYLGHPIFGDTRYGGDQILKGPVFSKYRKFVYNCFKILPHQALHAESLGFIHPNSQQNVHFQAALPSAFQEVLNKWKRYSANSQEAI